MKKGDSKVMGVLERKPAEKIVTTTIMYAFFCSLILPIVLLIMQASRLSDSTSATGNVKLGPIELLELQKLATAGGGYDASFSFKGGLVIYLILCSVTTILIIWLRIKRYEILKHNKNK